MNSIRNYKPPKAKEESADGSSTSTPKGPLPRQIGAAAFHTLAKQHDIEIFSASLNEVGKWLESNGINLNSLNLKDNKSKNSRAEISPPPAELNENADDKARCKHAAVIYLNGASLEDIKVALAEKKYINPATKLPPRLHNFLYKPILDPVDANALPLHRDYNHKIDLKCNTTAPFGPLYKMSVEELMVLQKYLKEQLDKGFICASNSPAASPVLFAKKPGGGLRFCIDY